MGKELFPLRPTRKENDFNGRFLTLEVKIDYFVFILINLHNPRAGFYMGNNESNARNVV